MMRKQLQLLKTCRLSQLSSKPTNRHLKTIESLQEILYYHLSGRTMIMISQQPIVIRHLLQRRTKKVKKRIRRPKISSRNRYQKKRSKLRKKRSRSKDKKYMRSLQTFMTATFQRQISSKDCVKSLTLWLEFQIKRKSWTNHSGISTNNYQRLFIYRL